MAVCAGCVVSEAILSRVFGADARGAESWLCGRSRQYSGYYPGVGTGSVAVMGVAAGDYGRGAFARHRQRRRRAAEPRHAIGGGAAFREPATAASRMMRSIAWMREDKMDGSQAIPHATATDRGLDFDAIVIGAGVSGLYQLYRLRELGLKVRVFETGSAVGGTWYWNRYPGARFDSESWTYGYSFSQELLDEWDWEEHFAGQPETERYLNYVADKFDLRRDIEFKCRVTAAHYRENTRSWDIALEDGRRYTARFLVTAVGVLSAATLPNIPGVESFRGPSFHTHYWPKEPVSFVGKRVAVIGTGATGIQTITEVAKTVGHLTVFQRTPQWAAPLHNAKITKEVMAHIRENYADIFSRCQETFGCFIHAADPRLALEVPEEEREAFWEKLYGEPGFG